MKRPLKSALPAAIITVLFFNYSRAQQALDPAIPAVYFQLENSFRQQDYKTCLTLETQVDHLLVDRTDTLAANSISYLADSYYYEGDLQKAIGLYEKKLALDEKMEGSSSMAYEETLADLASTVAESGNTGRGIELYRNLLPLDYKNYGVNSLEYVQTVNELGKLYIKTRAYSEAESQYAQLLKEVSKENVSYPVMLDNLADIYIAQGEYSEAKKILGRALGLIDRNEGRDNEYYAATLYNLSKLYYQQGDYANSELMNLESLKTVNRIGKVDHTDLYAANINQLGVTYTYMGLYSEAGKYLEEKEQLDRAGNLKDRASYAITMNNLANLYTFQGDYVKAEEDYKKSMDIIKSIYSENSVDYALSLNNLAYLYRKMDRPKDAIPLYSRSAEIYKSHFGDNHPDYARSIYNLGIAYFSDNDKAHAEPYLLQSLALRRTSLGMNHPRYAESLHSLALLRWDQGQYKEAETYFNGLFTNYDHQVSEFFTVLSEQEKAAFFNNRLRTSYEQFNNYGISRYKDEPGISGRIYDNQLATKGLILYSTDRVRRAILNSGDSALIAKYNRWLNIKEQIASYYSEARESSIRSEKSADSLNALANQIEKELNVATGTLENADNAKKITWKDIQKNLGKNEAAIEILRMRQFKPARNGQYSDSIYYVALMITSRDQQHPDMVILHNGLEMENKYIAVYRNSIRFRMADPYSYSVFWKPLTPYLKGIKKIFISLDGIYNEISLNTLWNPETGKYLLDEYDINLLTNTRDMLALKENKPVPSKGQVYLFGFPNYNMGLTKGEIDSRHNKKVTVEQKVDRGLGGMDRGLRGSLRGALRGGSLLQELPGTKTEVEKIDSVYKLDKQQPVLLTGNQAVEGAVKNVDEPRALHIATHGFFLQDDDLPVSDEEDVYTQNPLLRSGLILAGVNNFLTRDASLDDLGGEDGILTAYEAMNLNLDHTDIVVLSACETGLGALKNGEGVYGLQRAFEIAGAKSLIMSLWSVDDDATQELMSDFYTNWQKSGDKKEAFKAAQETVREKYKDPFFWGAFILVGT